MAPILFAVTVAFAVSFGLTPVVRAWSIRRGMLDHPDMARKVHRLPIPRTGGIAIVAAYFLATVALIIWPMGHASSLDVRLMLGILPAASIVFVVGLLDDLYGLGPFQKLVPQVFAAGLAWWGGVAVQGISGIDLQGWWGLPVTVVWLVACANAFNLIDGVDGLAAGVGLIAACTTMFAGLLSENTSLALAVAPLVGALLAFLRYNFNPATIFLGDSGSLSIGFLLGCYAAVWGQKSTTLMGLTAPLMALAIPLSDTGLAIVRRFLRRQPIFVSDRNHIHHRLLARGLSARDVAFVLCGVGGLAGGFALFQTATRSRFSGLVVVAFGGLAWLLVRSLGYIEFQTARYLASTGVFRQILQVQVYCRDMKAKFDAAAGPDDCWAIVKEAASTFGFASVRLQVGGRAFQFVDGSEGSAATGQLPPCRLHAPLANGDFVEFAYVADSSAQHAVVAAALADALTQEFGIDRRRPSRPAADVVNG